MRLEVSYLVSLDRRNDGLQMVCRRRGHVSQASLTHQENVPITIRQ